MENKITQTNCYGYTPTNTVQRNQAAKSAAHNQSPAANNRSESSDSQDTSGIKILAAQLAAAKSSVEASLYLAKLKIELSKIQNTKSNLALINKVKKVIQNGNKKVSQLKEEEELESKRKSAESKNDKETASSLDDTIKEKKRKRILRENNDLPKLDKDGSSINLENIAVSLGADFSAIAGSDMDVSV